MQNYSMIESKQGVYYMRIDFNTNNQVNQNFRAVNQKYLKDAQRMFEKRGTITSEWIESLTDDVALFKEISKQDAIDTMNAAKKYVNKGSLAAYKSTLDYFKSL